MHCLPNFILLLALLLSPAAATAGATIPAVGTPERTAVLDAARVPIQAEIGVPIKFVVETLRVVDDWAFVSGLPVGRDGRPVDYAKTRYAEAIAEGMFDDGVFVLLQRREGVWSAITHVIGATDVPYVGWSEEFGAPSGLFESGQ